jgi:hypothetical protein
MVPLISSQIFWFILLQKTWYYWWLGIWLVIGSLAACFIVGSSQRQMWLSVIGRFIALTIMPALLLVFVPSQVSQAFLTIFLAFSAIGYYYFIFEKFLLKRSPAWWPTIFQVILGLNLIISLIVMYGLVEFLNFSIFISALLISLLLGFLKYFYDASFEPSWLNKVVVGVEGTLGFRSSSIWLKQFQEATKVGLFALELFLVIWLLPQVFYLKALVVAAGLIFWVSQPSSRNVAVYWIKWIVVALIITIILLLSRWF